jgi:hypothetical protein
MREVICIFWRTFVAATMVAAICFPGSTVQTVFAAETPTLSAEQTDFFETKIRPILVKSCYECHTDDAGGGLRIDSANGLIKGGERGSAIVPGDADGSLLIKAVSRTGDLKMPPEDALSAVEIADLRAWITMGAPDPRVNAAEPSRLDQLFEAAKTHWAFQPVASPEIPDAAPKERVRSPIDAFIQARLQSQGWTMAPRSDRRTLIRRAWLDLIGLPPSPEEVAAFVQDESADAFTHLVDKLLAMPQYGERWGRHWLDVARYADSKGTTSNHDDRYPYAWTYRDYVIRAFNADLPYNRFVQEQLAADLLELPSDNNQALAALGFITVGGQPDPSALDDITDDRIDVISRGFLGLSVGCARCHDHKLEPIPTADYYALYGVLRSCSEPEMLPELKPQVDSPETQFYRDETKRLRQVLVTTRLVATEKVLSTNNVRVGDYLLAVLENQKTMTWGKPPILDYINKRQLIQFSYNHLIHIWDKWVVANPSLFRPWLELSALGKDVFAEKAAALVAGYAANADKQLNPHVARLFTSGVPQSMAEVAARYNQLFAAMNVEWQKAAAGRLKSAQQIQPEDLTCNVATLERRSVGRMLDALLNATLSDTDQEGLRKVLFAEESPFRFKPEQFVGHSEYFPVETRNELVKMTREISQAEQLPGAPARAMAFVETKPFEAKVLIRGNPKNLGAPAPRQFLRVLAGDNRKPFPADQSGRLQLAQAITDRSNPLTARVIVNRVWGWHFGQPLVSTASDFGLRGEMPSHPELLDYLATRFMDEGWSIKSLHRAIMNSHVYQQSSSLRDIAASADASKSPRVLDPENRLLWRFPARPIEFEPMRDSMLAVAKQLDETREGKPIDVTDPKNRRRSIYSTVDRKMMAGVMRSFEVPNPSFSSPGRARSILAPQSLYLLNGSFVISAARALADRVRPAAEGQTEAAINQLYQVVLQRDPTPRERDKAKEFIKNYPDKDVVLPEARDWSYGFAELEPSSGSLKEFVAITQFSGDAIKGGKIGEQDVTGLEMNAEGGSPPALKAVVRRWTAPIAGKIKISAELAHSSAQGAGVSAVVIQNQAKILGQWTATNQSVMTIIEPQEVKAGDTIDFVVTARDDPQHANFKWAPTVFMIDHELTFMPGMAMRWDARDNFKDPSQLPVPLDPWSELAQVMLVSAEFLTLE